MEISKTGIYTTTKPVAVEADEVDVVVDTASIVAEIQAGNIKAFDTLVNMYRQRIYSIIYNLTSNAEDAADLTQDTFIKAFKYIHQFKATASIYTWLYRIAINTTYTHLKKNKWSRCFSFNRMKSGSDEDENTHFIEQLASNDKTEKSVFLKELQENLNEALQRLSIEHRTVVILFEIEDMSHEEIAEIMGCSEGTVRSRLHYAKSQLQHYLKEYLQ